MTGRIEVYADEVNDRVYVGDGRGPYIIIEADGPVGESYTPRGGELVFGGELDAYGYEEGFEEGRKHEREEMAVAIDAERALRFRIALRYHPMSLKGGRRRP